MRILSLFFFFLPFAIAANSTLLYTPCEMCTNQASSKQLAEIELRKYTGKTVDNYTSVQVGNVLNLFDSIDPSKSTAVFIFGWLGTPYLPSTQAIVKAYLSRGDHNILILDWHKISHERYPYAANSVEGIGYTLATALNKLVAAGLSQAGIQIIGHSLGAQISGYTGRFVNFTLPRITGLDPAGPRFYPMDKHLTSSDAQFVVIIHTDRGKLGINLQTGDVDFYPNNGINVQPGCLIGLDICSHYRSVYYYAESVQYENSFIGISCDSYSNFIAGSCSSNSKTVMGYATPIIARGKYYLKTKNESPYGLGENGTKT